MFAVVSFILHPINFTRGLIWSWKTFDRHGYPRDGSI
jgi:hypothetical protein